MDTETLRNQVTSFESDQVHLQIAAECEANPARRTWAEQRVGMLGMIVGQIRAEIRSRDTSDARPLGATQRFENHLERVLEDYLDTG